MVTSLSISPARVRWGREPRRAQMNGLRERFSLLSHSLPPLYERYLSIHDGLYPTEQTPWDGLSMALWA
jgi:hypothetical protein